MDEMVLVQGRKQHTFEFLASDIAEAAASEAEYHRARKTYWEEEYEISVKQVEATIGAKVVKHPSTDGYTVDVIVDYGDRDAYTRLQQAFRKINNHREQAELFESDAATYGLQGERFYELSREDVRFYRLGGEPRDDS